MFSGSFVVCLLVWFLILAILRGDPVTSQSRFSLQLPVVEADECSVSGWKLGTVAEDQTLACFADVGGGSVNSVVSENEHFLHFLHGHSFRSKRYACSIYSEVVFLQIPGRTLK